jgi:hypothetical protein
LSNDRNGCKVRSTERLDVRLAETVAAIVAKHSDPGRILELYYWSREPVLFQAMRSLMQMRLHTRRRLLCFLSAVSEPGSIHAKADQDGGRLTLCRHHVKEPPPANRSAHDNENRERIGNGRAAWRA